MEALSFLVGVLVGVAIFGLGYREGRNTTRIDLSVAPPQVWTVTRTGPDDERAG